MSRIGRCRPLTWLAIAWVRAWRSLVSPLYGPVCKYQPSCSSFGLRALQVHGVFTATPMIVWRILRCNPWSHGGYDPVPGTPEAHDWATLHPETVTQGWVTTFTGGRCDAHGVGTTSSDHSRAGLAGNYQYVLAGTPCDSRGEN